MAIPLTAREPIEFSPPSLPKHLQGPDPEEPGKPKFRLIVRVPTMMERDGYAAALVRGGVIHYTRQQIRDLSLAGVQELFDEKEHEELQALLQEVWTVADAEAQCEREQQDKLREIHEKAAGTNTKIDPKDVIKELEKIVPSAQMDKSRRVRGIAINQELMSRYQPLIHAIASLAEQDAKRAWLNAEVYVAGWKGLEHEPEGNGRGGLKTHEVEYLRREIGADAFDELSEFITAMQAIDGEEEKNLASLLENTSAQTGSTQSESTASSDDGSSTAEPSGSIPEAESPKTTGSSSRSTTRSATKKGKSRRSSRTAARSSTSPSS